jgi:hypothetical protein
LLSTRRFLARTVFAVLAAVTLSIAGLASPASAAGETGTASTAVHQQTFQVKVPAGVRNGAAADLAITCNLRVDYPHNSSHVFGTVNAVAQITCDTPVYGLGLEVDLMRDSQLAAANYSENYGVAALTVNTAADCVPGGYYVHANAVVVFPEGVVPPTLSDSQESATLSIGC